MTGSRGNIIVIRQPVRGYRFSSDSVLLAGFAAPFCRGAVLDLGTGCGVLLLLLSRLSPRRVTGTGVELQGGLIAFARDNFRENGLSGQLVAVPGDVRGDIPGVEPGSFDLVVSNPPYIRAGRGRRNPDPGKEAARHEVTCTLPELFSSAARYLAADGRFAFILPAPRRAEIESCAAKEGLRLECLRPVQPRDGEPPYRLLCCAVRGGTGAPRVLPALFLRGAGGAYSPEVERVCRLFRGE